MADISTKKKKSVDKTTNSDRRFFNIKYDLPPLKLGDRIIDFDRRRLFLLGIPSIVSTADLLAQFSKYGRIVDVQILVDGLSIYSRGSAFILFDDEKSVHNVYRAAPGNFIRINNQWVYVCVGTPKMPFSVHIHNAMLFVSAIPDYLTKDGLKNFFSTFGKVVGGEIVHDLVTKRPRGLGFVLFDKEDVVNESFASTNSLDINGSNVVIEQAIPKSSGRLNQGVVFPRFLMLVDNCVNESHVFSEDLSTVTRTNLNFADFSFSKIVGGRFVFLIHSISPIPEESEHSVFFFDFSKLVPYTPKKAPRLNYKKFSPTIIVMGSKIFVFSSSFYLVNGNSDESCGRIGEVLETNANFKNWNWMKLPPFPKLQSSKKVLERRFIVAFATQEPKGVIHLGLGSAECLESSSSYPRGDFSISYYADHDGWTDISHESLPFHGEGKFVGSLCYGFPCKKRPSCPPYLCSYRLTKHEWKIVREYQLPSGSLVSFLPYLQDFYFLGEDICVLIQGRRVTFESERVRRNFLEVDVVQLSETKRVLSHVTYENAHMFRGILGVRY